MGLCLLSIITATPLPPPSRWETHAIGPVHPWKVDRNRLRPGNDDTQKPPAVVMKLGKGAAGYHQGWSALDQPFYRVACGLVLSRTKSKWYCWIRGSLPPSLWERAARRASFQAWMCCPGRPRIAFFFPIFGSESSSFSQSSLKLWKSTVTTGQHSSALHWLWLTFVIQLQNRFSYSVGQLTIGEGVHLTNLFTELLVALPWHEPSLNDTAESGVLCRLLSESEPPGGSVSNMNVLPRAAQDCFLFFCFLVWVFFI